MSNWVICEPNYNKAIKVTVFDDGNTEYKKYTNKWFIISTWRGKVKLINIDNTTIINSISEWKTASI
tara:strand:+ start:3423 stop:3623 length:201 start_codon:yes stop_codon:yes gene_type:complete